MLPQRFFDTSSGSPFSLVGRESANAQTVRLTCALRGGYVWTGLVLEEEPAVVRAGVDVARRVRARTVASIVREGHGAAKGAGYGRRLLAEHGVQQRIPRDVGAERRQGVSAVAKGCNGKLIGVNRSNASVGNNKRGRSSP